MEPSTIFLVVAVMIVIDYTYSLTYVTYIKMYNTRNIEAVKSTGNLVLYFDHSAAGKECPDPTLIKVMVVYRVDVPSITI